MTARRLPPVIQQAIDKAAREDESRLPPRAARLELTLPFPPSVNEPYRMFTLPNGRMGRAKSSRLVKYGQAVREKMRLWMLENNARPPGPPYRLMVLIYPPDDKRKHDASNLIKHLEDAIFSAIEGEDDNDVVTLSAVKKPPSNDPRVRVRLEGTT